jgi:hypothetical protein
VNRIACAALCLAAAFSLCDRCPSDRLNAAELRAGVASVDLTPPLKLKPPLGGYGDRMNRPATGVHDRIMAKALVFSDGRKKFALLTADMLGFAPPVKQAVLDRLADKGWTADNVMLLPSHSHTSIEMNAINPLNIYRVPQIGIHNPELFELTMKTLAQTIAEAEKNPVPVRVGTSSIELRGWNRNRRIPNGPTDPELTVLRVDRTDGKPLAVLVNWTAHPTFMDPEDMWFSGDWPGHCQRTMESLIGDGVVAMYCNGAEGDQSPTPRPNSGESHWEQAERYGRDVGIAAWRAWQNASTAPHAALSSWREEIALPPHAWHPNFMATGGKEYGFTEAMLKDMLPQMYPRSTASVSLRVGDFVLVGIPGEMAAELGLEVKRRTRELTGARHAVIGGLADEWLSYIIPLKQYQLGAYEASVSFYGPKLAEVIVTGAVRGVEHLRAPH